MRKIVSVSTQKHSESEMFLIKLKFSLSRFSVFEISDAERRKEILILYQCSPLESECEESISEDDLWNIALGERGGRRKISFNPFCPATKCGKFPYNR